MKSDGFCGKNCYWISCSLMAGASMGTGSFLFASNFSDYATYGLAIIGPGGFLMCMMIRVITECRYRIRTGSWFKPKGSRVMGDDGKLLWRSLIPITVNVLTNGGMLVVMALGWKLGKAAGLNQGVILTLLSLASLFNIVIFYFKFGEKISPLHFIGIFLMLACVLCISIAATSSDDDDEDNFDSDDSMGLN